MNHSQLSSDPGSVMPTPTKASSGLGHLLQTNRWAQALEIAVIFSPLAIAVMVFEILQIENPLIAMGIVWTAYAVILALIDRSVRWRGESWQAIGVQFTFPTFRSGRRTLLQSLMVFVFALLAFVLGTIVMANLVGIPEPADMSRYNYLKGNLPLLAISLLGVYIASSFGEEVIYRGFLLTRLEALFNGVVGKGTLIAVITSAVIFGFAHYQWGAMGIGQTTGMGLALAISFLWTKRNLWPLVLAHACMDTILLVQLFFA